MHVNFPPEVDAKRFRGHAVLISAEETRSGSKVQQSKA